jgi:hypothetical protein
MKPREHRTRRIRRYVVTATVTLFLAVWSVVYTEMRTGENPPLGSGTAVATATQDTSSSDDSATSSSPTDSAPAAVTTQQS